MRNTVVAVIVLALIAGFLGGFSVAYQRYKPLLERNSSLIIAKDTEITQLKKEKDAVNSKKSPITYFLQSGKLMVDNGNSISALTKEASMSSGIRITTNGTVIRPNGTRFTLSEGEFFGMK